MDTESSTYINDDEFEEKIYYKPAQGFRSLGEICRWRIPFELAALPYAFNALEPTIDEETMRVHHDKHHKAYVDKTNAAFALDSEASTDDADISMQKIFSHINDYPPAVRNNVGGHFNHTFFWSVLTPDAQKRKIPQRLHDEIESVFGTIEEFKAEFEKAGTAQFGSGWVWLIRTSSGNLNITTTKNQDNPLMSGVEFDGFPILGIDVWEHAYYLKHHEKRADYLKEIWSVINWAQVNEYDLEACKEYPALH